MTQFGAKVGGGVAKYLNAEVVATRDLNSLKPLECINVSTVMALTTINILKRYIRSLLFS